MHDTKDRNAQLDFFFWEKSDSVYGFLCLWMNPPLPLLSGSAVGSGAGPSFWPTSRLNLPLPGSASFSG